MKLLVLATNYPRPDGFVSLQYIHTRNCWYQKYNIEVSVLSFAATYDYEIDGVKVYTEATYERELSNKKYDLLISHAPNIRQHYKFLTKYESVFDKIVFFFHGHEVLRASAIYPKPYDYVKKASLASRISREIYDTYKLYFWKGYFQKILYKAHFVFVSNWMYEMFLNFVKINPSVLGGRKHIIYNSIGENFEKLRYDHKSEKDYDFITIRANLDSAKYGIDIVNTIAKNNPEFKFCIVGKGEFFKYNKKADNVVWVEKHLNHKEIVSFLDKSRCALLPTRADAQGVMACEMATFGIPLITSNIDVCKEVFWEFDNVRYIENDVRFIDIKPLFEDLLKVDFNKTNDKYYSKKTIDKEVELFYEVKGSSQ